MANSKTNGSIKCKGMKTILEKQVGATSQST